MVLFNKLIIINLAPRQYQSATTSKLDIGLHIIYTDYMSMHPKVRKKCLNCGEDPLRATYTYCSNACQIEYQYEIYIKKWKNGMINGLQSIGIVSKHIKRYLRRKFGDKCSLCGWSKINLETGQAPLVADHTDGNWRNNIESNLRLICPNCDALTPTYAGLNKGNGRKNQILSNRAKEGLLLMITKPK